MNAIDLRQPAALIVGDHLEGHFEGQNDAGEGLAKLVAAWSS